MFETKRARNKKELFSQKEQETIKNCF